MDKQTLLDYAIIGARSRLAALKQEQAELLGLFPELGSTRRRFTSRNGATASDAPIRRRRRTFTAAQRREVSERMKRYWAARRKQR